MGATVPGRWGLQCLASGLFFIPFESCLPRAKVYAWQTFVECAIEGSVKLFDMSPLPKETHEKPFAKSIPTFAMSIGLTSFCLVSRFFVSTLKSDFDQFSDPKWNMVAHTLLVYSEEKLGPQGAL
jgi:hypothetical protein